MLKQFSIPNLRRKHLANSHVSLRFKICHQDVSACVASTQHLSNFRLQAWSSKDRHDIRFQTFTRRFFFHFLYLIPIWLPMGLRRWNSRACSLNASVSKAHGSRAFLYFMMRNYARKLHPLGSFDIRSSILTTCFFFFSFASDFSNNHFRRHTTDSLNSSLSKGTQSLQNQSKNLDCYFIYILLLGVWISEKHSTFCLILGVRKGLIINLLQYQGNHPVT